MIYDLLDDVKAAMEGKLRSVEERVAVGKAEVKAQFGSGENVMGQARKVYESVERGPHLPYGPNV